jgi:RHS repeat-associated protein
VLLPDGLTTDYVYDDLNRLTLETITGDDPSTANTVETRPVLKFDYNYYDSGAATEELRRRFMIESDGQRGGVVETRYNADGSTFSTNYIDYEYDDGGRLKKETRDLNNDGNNDTDDSITTYAYDQVGNRLSELFDSSDNTKDDTVTYRYGEVDGSFNLTSTDANDHLRWERHVVNGVTTTTEYRYDANGSITEKITTGGSAADLKYVWDLRNRLVGLDANADGDTLDAGDINYAYDTDGDRVSQATTTTTTTFLVDKDNPTGYSQPLEERTGTTLTTTYVIGADVIAQARSSQSHGLEYLLYDGHGSTRAVAKASVTSFSDSLIVVNSAIDYDGFGNAAGQVSLATASGVSEMLYSGEQYDSGLQEQFLRDRYYNQVIGRFSSYDPQGNDISDPTHLHKYLYAGDDPVAFDDPSGDDFDMPSQLVAEGIRGMVMGILLTTFKAAYAAAAGAEAGLSGDQAFDWFLHDEWGVQDINPATEITLLAVRGFDIYTGDGWSEEGGDGAGSANGADGAALLSGGVTPFAAMASTAPKSSTGPMNAVTAPGASAARRVGKRISAFGSEIQQFLRNGFQSIAYARANAKRSGNPAVNGTYMHSEAAKYAKKKGLYGAEVSYRGGKTGKQYVGAKGSVRLDGILGDVRAPQAVLDYKPSTSRGLSASRERQIRSNLPRESQKIPIIVVYY